MKKMSNRLFDIGKEKAIRKVLKQWAKYVPETNFNLIVLTLAMDELKRAMRPNGKRR